MWCRSWHSRRHCRLVVQHEIQGYHQESHIDGQYANEHLRIESQRFLKPDNVLFRGFHGGLCRADLSGDAGKLFALVVELPIKTFVSRSRLAYVATEAFSHRFHGAAVGLFGLRLISKEAIGYGNQPSDVRSEFDQLCNSLGPHATDCSADLGPYCAASCRLFLPCRRRPTMVHSRIAVMMACDHRQ